MMSGKAITFDGPMIEFSVISNASIIKDDFSSTMWYFIKLSAVSIFLRDEDDSVTVHDAIVPFSQIKLIFSFAFEPSFLLSKVMEG